MPSGFDPRCPYDLWLDQFADVPAEVKPVWTFRRLNGAEYIKLDRIVDLYDKRPSECGDELFAMLAIGLLDWKHQTDPATGEAVPFDPEKINQIIDHVDAFELVAKRLARARVNGTELKNSESPASSVQAKS